MDSEDLIASLATLIDKNDPMVASLVGGSKAAEAKGTAAGCSRERDLKENVNPRRRVSALESSLDKSPLPAPSRPKVSPAAESLLRDVVNGRRNSDTKALAKNYTTDCVKGRKKDAFVFEDEIKEENEFDECDLQPHVNATTRQQTSRKGVETLQAPKDKECTFVPNTNPIRKSSTGRKLQEYLSKNPYQRLSSMVNTKVLNDKPSNMKEVIEKRKLNDKRQIALSNVKGDVSKKILRKASPKINEKHEEITTKFESKLRNVQRKFSPNRGEEQGTWSCSRPNHCSRNAKSPSMHTKQTLDERRPKESLSPSLSGQQLGRLKSHDKPQTRLQIRSHLETLIKRIEQEKELKERVVTERRQRLEEECMSKLKQVPLQSRAKNSCSSSNPKAPH